MEDPAPIAPGEGRLRTILLVEDEVLIRVVAAEALREAGFVVIEASGADEAASLVAAGFVPDVLFTDVRMPGARDGLMLARDLKAQLPRVIVFVASGHADPRDALQQAHRFFLKPYDLATVVRAISEALDQHEH